MGGDEVVVGSCGAVPTLGFTLYFSPAQTAGARIGGGSNTSALRRGLTRWRWHAINRHSSLSLFQSVSLFFGVNIKRGGGGIRVERETGGEREDMAVGCDRTCRAPPHFGGGGNERTPPQPTRPSTHPPPPPHVTKLKAAKTCTGLTAFTLYVAT